MSELTVVQQQLPDPNELYNQGKAELGNLRELRVGQGSTVFFTDKEGSRWGHINFESAKAYIKIDGSAKFKTAAGDVLMSTDATDGNFINVINTALNTASKTILSDFTFQDTDYQGAFKAGNPTWSTSSGLITGGSGVLINARGILGAANGVATFTLDATTGNATFAGTLTAASGTLGSITIGTNAWHVDSSGNMWWGSAASYAAATIKVSAAGSIDFTTGNFSGTLSAPSGTLGTITAGTINGATITGGTVRTNGTGSGLNTQMTSALNYIEFQYDGSTKASIYSDSGGRLALSSNNNWYAFGDDMNFLYNDDNDGTDAYWWSNGDMKMHLTTGGELRVEDDVVAFAGIDFAEMFESVDGSAIPVGTSVVLVNEKVRPAKNNENPIGIISSTPGYICNGGESDAGTAWDGKYLRDEFMNPIMEEADFWSIKKTDKSHNDERSRRLMNDEPLNGFVDETDLVPEGAIVRKVLRKKVNPEWDSRIPYIPRSERPEWNIVGLVGRIRLMKGQPVSKNWVKLREISYNVEEWLVR